MGHQLELSQNSKIQGALQKMPNNISCARHKNLQVQHIIILPEENVNDIQDKKPKVVGKKQVRRRKTK